MKKYTRPILKEGELAPMPETNYDSGRNRCPSRSATNRACTRDEGHDGPHFHDVVMPRVPRFVSGLSVHGPVVADPLPAPDAPQVERFHPKRDKDADRAYMDAGKKGDWVRYTDYATLEAEKQQLEDENRRIIDKIKALKEAHDRDAVENEFFDVLAEAK